MYCRTHECSGLEYLYFPTFIRQPAESTLDYKERGEGEDLTRYSLASEISDVELDPK